MSLVESDSGAVSGLAEAAIVELRRLHSEKGGLTPTRVVAAAKRKNSPLHDYFEWDDHAASAAYREVQAAMIIRRVKIRLIGDVTDSAPTPVTVRLFHSVERGNGVYHEYAEVVADADMSAIVMQRMLADWATFKRRYESFAEFQALFGPVLDVIAQAGD